MRRRVPLARRRPCVRGFRLGTLVSVAAAELDAQTTGISHVSKPRSGLVCCGSKWRSAPLMLSFATGQCV